MPHVERGPGRSPVGRDAVVRVVKSGSIRYQVLKVTWRPRVVRSTVRVRRVSASSARYPPEMGCRPRRGRQKWSRGWRGIAGTWATVPLPAGAGSRRPYGARCREPAHLRGSGSAGTPPGPWRRVSRRASFPGCSRSSLWPRSYRRVLLEVVGSLRSLSQAEGGLRACRLRAVGDAVEATCCGRSAEEEVGTAVVGKLA